MKVLNTFSVFVYLLPNTVEPLLRGHPFERPPPLERPLDNVNLNINVLISTPDERPPFLKGHFSDAKELASQDCSTVPQNLEKNIEVSLIINKRLLHMYRQTNIF